MHSSWPRFCIPCMAGLRFPALLVKMCFSGPSGQSPLWEGFVVSNQYRCTILICDAQCRQDNQPITTRRCMMHIITGGFPIRSEESDEAHHIGSIVHIHQTLHEHIRTTSSCRLLFVLRTHMSMFAWCCHTSRHRRCPPSMVYIALYDGWLSPGAKSPSTVTMEYNYVSLPPVVCIVVDDDRLSPYANLPSNVTMENMFLYRKSNSNHRKGSGACCQLNSQEMMWNTLQARPTISQD